MCILYMYWVVGVAQNGQTFQASFSSLCSLPGQPQILPSKPSKHGTAKHLGLLNQRFRSQMNQWLYYMGFTAGVFTSPLRRAGPQQDCTNFDLQAHPWDGRFVSI